MQVGLGAHPIRSYSLGLYGNSTIAACALGTAAATVIDSSPSFAAARAIEVWNLTGVHLELVIGPDNGAAAYTNTTPGATPVMQAGNGTFFCPGNSTTSMAQSCRAERWPITITQGMAISVRTTNNTPVTCSIATPLIINFWE